MQIACLSRLKFDEKNLVPDHPIIGFGGGVIYPMGSGNSYSFRLSWRDRSLPNVIHQVPGRSQLDNLQCHSWTSNPESH